MALNVSAQSKARQTPYVGRCVVACEDGGSLLLTE